VRSDEEKWRWEEKMDVVGGDRRDRREESRAAAGQVLSKKSRTTY